MKICRILVMHFFLLISICLRAQETLPQLLKNLQNATLDSAKVGCYLKLINYYSLQNLDSFNWYANHALDYTHTTGYKLGEAQIYCYLAVIDANQGRVIVARQRVENALDIYREIKNMKGVAQAMHDLGAVEADQGNFDIAIKFFIGALRIYDTITDYHGQMLAYLNLGNLYLAHADTANARKYLTIAQQISKKIPLSNETIYLYNDFGVLHAMAGDKPGALNIFIRNLEISNKPEFIGSRLESLLYLGEYYVENNDFANALRYLDDGLKLSEAIHLPEMEANFLTDKAHIAEQTQPDSALVYLEKARTLCEHIQSKAFLKNVYNEIEALYEHKGDYKNALIAFKKKQKILDSLFTLNKTQEIETLGAEFDQERSKTRIIQLELQHEHETRTRNIILGVASIFIITFIILLIMYRRSTKLYHRLAENESELRQLNSTKDKLFSIIGHDLRGPISSIPIMLEIMEAEQTTTEERQFILNSLKEHAHATTETLDKLLYWGKSVLGGAILTRQQIETKPIVVRNIELKKFAAADKHITINDSTPDEFTIYADASHFDFIFRNLLDNSVKFTRPGGTITIDAVTDLNTGFAVFSVADNGVGISSSEIQKIFLPSKSTPGTAQEKGTGIGLMLCKEFARQNGGELWVESKEGVGTTFFFSVKKNEEPQNS